MADYDINSAFKAIEEELIASMIRNMEHHIDIEKSENMTYPQWQAEQLKALQEYRINNRHSFNRGTPNIRKQIEKAIRQAYKNGRTMQEAEILKAIKNGFVPPHKPSAAAQAEFFKINERKLNALIKSVTDDIVKANHATLRMANDQYRKTLFNAQVYFNTGTGNLRQAVDMAARDFLAKGINCVEYKNGRRVSAASYAQMALRTANTRAYLCGEAQMRDEWGISTVIVNKRGAACPLCMKWVGRVYYDDVWGHTNITDDKYPRLSTAIAGGLYHPNCKDGHTTYFEGVSTPPAEPTKQDIVQANEVSRAEAKANYAARQVEKYRRLAEYSLDDDNKAKYRQRLSEWQKQVEIAENNVANDGNGGIIKEKDLSNYIGRKIEDTDNQSVREWYVANVSDIPNQVDKTKSFEEQVQQAYNLRNKYKREARVAMSDRKTAENLEIERPVKSFEELLRDKMIRKKLSKQEALEDILKTASKTNADVNKEFNL